MVVPYTFDHTLVFFDWHLSFQGVPDPEQKFNQRPCKFPFQFKLGSNCLHWEKFLTAATVRFVLLTAQFLQ